MAGIRLSAADLQGAQVLEQPTSGIRLGSDDLAGLQDLDTGAPSAPAKPEPTWFESLARGAAQGATMGFADEIAGGIESAFSDKTYEQARNESRANFKAADEANPIASTIGNVGGGLATALIPGGAIVKGAGFAAHAARGAGAGILSGFGTSEAKDTEGMVKDAATSGLIGGALGLVGGKIAQKVAGAGARVDQRLIQDITGGRATTAGKKIHQNAPQVLEAARKFGLEKVARDPAALLKESKAAARQVGQQIGQVYEEADRMFMGVKASDVAAALRAEGKKYSSPADAPLRRQIDSLVKEVKTSWGSGPRARVPLEKVNQLATKLEATGFASADLTPGAAAQLKRDLAKGVNKALQRRVAEIQEFAGHVKSTPTAQNSAPFADSVSAAAGIKRLPELNREYQGLKRIEKMAGEVSALPDPSKAAGGLRNAMGQAVDTGALAASIYTANPLPYLATKVGLPVAKEGFRAADVALAKLYSAAQAGQVTAQLIQRALEVGVPRGLVARFSPSVTTQQQPP